MSLHTLSYLTAVAPIVVSPLGPAQPGEAAPIPPARSANIDTFSRLGGPVQKQVLARENNMTGTLSSTELKTGTAVSGFQNDAAGDVTTPTAAPLAARATPTSALGLHEVDVYIPNTPAPVSAPKPVDRSPKKRRDRLYLLKQYSTDVLIAGGALTAICLLLLPVSGVSVVAGVILGVVCLVAGAALKHNFYRDASSSNALATTVGKLETEVTELGENIDHLEETRRDLQTTAHSLESTQTQMQTEVTRLETQISSLNQEVLVALTNST